MTTVNLIIFGIGNVGSTLLNQLTDFKEELKQQQQIDLKIPVICNSEKMLFKSDLSKDWESLFLKDSKAYQLKDVFEFISEKNLENVVVVDVTANEDFPENYPLFVSHKFHIVAANKTANTLDFEFYKNLRDALKAKNVKFEYETNVGAGLPVIETVKSLKASGEKVKKIRGVFSGSLSYIFNRFSDEDILFSEVLNDASQKGYTEPDARDDLSGKDVARKLLILGRELGLQQNLSAVNVQSLVPNALNGKTTLKEFNNRVGELDTIFQDNKSKKEPNDVLRYIGELDLDKNELSVKLINEPKTTSLGQLKGADTLFEIYTESYNESPLVIQGAGAGKEVTARGLFSDILKVANSLN